MIDHANANNEIPINEVIRIAKDYVKAMYVDTPIYDVMLEEIVRPEGSSRWLITIGFSTNERKKIDPSAKTSAALSAALARRDQFLERNYKVIEIDATNGDVLAMRIRNITAGVD